MIYFLFGQNSYQALRKIREFKEAFAKKAVGAYLIEEYDGEPAPIADKDFHSFLGQASLFVKTRLVIFKNILSDNIFKILKKNGDFLKASKDVFVYWEREPDKFALAFFKKYSAKIQEVKLLGAKELDLWLQKNAGSLGINLSKEEREAMMEEAGAGAEWALENELEKRALAPPLSSTSDVESQKHRMFSRAAASPFAFVEKIFSASFGRALLALKEAEAADHEPQKFIYPLLWKAKQKKMPDAYLAGILAESAMRKDPKNSYEILERFILAIKV